MGLKLELIPLKSEVGKKLEKLKERYPKGKLVPKGLAHARSHRAFKGDFRIRWGMTTRQKDRLAVKRKRLALDYSEAPRKGGTKRDRRGRDGEVSAVK